MAHARLSAAQRAAPWADSAPPLSAHAPAWALDPEAEGRQPLRGDALAAHESSASATGVPRLLPLALGLVAALGSLWLWQRQAQAQADTAPTASDAASGARTASPPAVAVRSVPSVDLKRYQGHWYEVARLPTPFEAGCLGQPTASYRLEGERMVVLNRCVGARGAVREAAGIARVVPGTGNAQLKVSFAPGWLRWLPAVWADYWVLALDAEYQVALVGTPARDALWVLARQPQISQSALQALTRRARAMGFATHKLHHAAA